MLRFISAEDVIGSNMIGAIVHDEYLFAKDEVTCIG